MRTNLFVALILPFLLILLVLVVFILFIVFLLLLSPLRGVSALLLTRVPVFKLGFLGGALAFTFVEGYGRGYCWCADFGGRFGGWGALAGLGDGLLADVVGS